MIEALFHRLSEAVSYLPRPWSQALALRLGGALFRAYRLSPYRNELERGIQEAFPELEPPEQRRLLREHVNLLLWAMVDFLRFRRFPSDTRLPPELLITGWEHAERALHSGRGVILVSAHFGCWEMIPAVVALQGFPVTVAVQKPSEPAFEALFTQFRHFAGVQTCNNDYTGLRQIVAALKRRECVGLVIDQHGENERLIGRFFGHRVSLPEGPATLARRYDAVLVPVLNRWWGSKQHMEFFAPIAPADFESDLALMQSIYDWLEQQIRRYPENWLWTYNRWDKYVG